MTNTISKKTPTITLKGYYDSLPAATCPKTDLVTKIQVACGVSMTTVRNWITGRTKPIKQEYIDKICGLTGIDKENLWAD